MKHIVFVVGSYYPTYSAVSKCVGNVADELSKTHQVTVICEKNTSLQADEEVFNNQKIIRIMTNEKRTREKIDGRIQTSQGIARRITQCTMTLYKLFQAAKTVLSKVSIKRELVDGYLEALKAIQAPIDIIIPASMPFESVVAAFEYKSNAAGKEIIIPYLFDQFADSDTLHWLKINKKMKRKRHIQLEEKILSGADLVLAMYSLKNHFTSALPLLQNIHYTEHPLLLNCYPEGQNDAKGIKISYIGGLYKNYVVPDYLLKLFKKVTLQDAVLHFYIIGNCFNTVNKYSRLMPERIVNHGSVDKQTANNEIANSNILISIAEKKGIQMSSKIFEYMSCGKPIIHFYSADEDVNVKTLSQYPPVLCIKQDTALLWKNARKFEAFCRMNANTHLPFEEVERLFPDAAPQYTARLIEEFAQKAGKEKQSLIEKTGNIMQQVHEAQLLMALEVKKICEKHDINFSIIAGTLLGAVRHQGFIPWDDDLDIGMLRKDFNAFIRVAPDELKQEYFLQTWETDSAFALSIAKIRKNGTTFIEQNSRHSSLHNGIYIDIFPFDNVPPSVSQQKRHNRVTYVLKRILLMKQKYEVWGKDERIKKLVYKLNGILTKTFSILKIEKMLYRQMTRYNGDNAETVVAIGGSYGYRKESIRKEWLTDLSTLHFEGYELPCPQKYADYLTYFYGDYMTPPPENKRCSKHNIIQIEVEEKDK